MCAKLSAVPGTGVLSRRRGLFLSQVPLLEDLSPPWVTSGGIDGKLEGDHRLAALSDLLAGFQMKSFLGLL